MEKWEQPIRNQARGDTWRWLLNTRLGWIWAIVGGGTVTGVFGASALWARVLAGFGGSIAAVAVIVGITYLAYLWITPRHQRNEAIGKIKEQEEQITKIKQEHVEQIAEMKLTENMAYSLQITGVVGNWPKDTKGLGIIVKLRNIFGKPLRYQVRRMAIRLDDNDLKAPSLANNGGIIYDESDFIMPLLLPNAGPTRLHNGIVNFTIDYGRPDERIRRRIDVSATLVIDKATTNYYWKKLQETPINLEFTDEMPSWQPIPDTGKSQSEVA